MKGCPEFDLWTDHAPLVQAMQKEIRHLTPRMQKFREAIQAFNAVLSFVKGASNHISDALLRSPVGGSEGIDRILRTLRGHASYAYNRVISCVTGDICTEVLEDPALDEMWEAAKMDKGYKEVAETVKRKDNQET